MLDGLLSRGKRFIKLWDDFQPEIAFQEVRFDKRGIVGRGWRKLRVWVAQNRRSNANLSMPPRMELADTLRDLSHSAFRLNCFAKEAQQFGSDLLGVGPGDAVWASFHYHQASSLDEFGRP